MNRSKDKTLVIIYAGYILLVGIICTLVAGFDFKLILGLLIGATTALFNYFLLILAIRMIVGRPKILGVQFYILRLVVYLLSAYISVRIGNSTAIMFAIGVIGLSVAIFTTYGIGGMKEQ